MGTVDAAQAAGAGVAGFDEIGSEARPTEAPTSLLDGYLFVAKDDIILIIPFDLPFDAQRRVDCEPVEI